MLMYEYLLLFYLQMHHPVVPEPPCVVQICLVVLLLVSRPHPSAGADCCDHVDSKHHDPAHCSASERRVS